MCAEGTTSFLWRSRSADYLSFGNALKSLSQDNVLRIIAEFAAEQKTKPAGIQPEQVIKQIKEWEAEAATAGVASK